MEDIGNSIIEATDLRDELMKDIEEVEEKIFRDTKIVTMQEFLAIHDLNVDYSESTVANETLTNCDAVIKLVNCYDEDMDVFYNALSTMETASNFINAVDTMKLDQPRLWVKK